MEYTIASMFVTVIQKFIDAYRERTQQQRESTEALVALQREAMAEARKI